MYGFHLQSDLMATSKSVLPSGENTEEVGKMAKIVCLAAQSNPFKDFS
jgi:hypothetical protein